MINWNICRYCGCEIYMESPNVWVDVTDGNACDENNLTGVHHP